MPTAAKSSQETSEEEVTGPTMKEVGQIAEFLEARLENPELGLLPAAAAAYESGDWEGLAEVMQKKGGGTYSGEQLKSALAGSELLKNASEKYQEMQKNNLDQAA